MFGMRKFLILKTVCRYTIHCLTKGSVSGKAALPNTFVSILNNLENCSGSESRKNETSISLLSNCNNFTIFSQSTCITQSKNKMRK